MTIIVQKFAPLKFGGFIASILAITAEEEKRKEKAPQCFGSMLVDVPGLKSNFLTKSPKNLSAPAN